MSENVKNPGTAGRSDLGAPARFGAVDALRLRTLGAAVGVAMAGLSQYQLSQGQQTGLQLVLLIVGAAVFAFAVRTDALPATPLYPEDSRAPRYRLRADGMSLIPSAVTLTLSLILFWQDRQRGAAFIIWIAAMIWYVTSYLPGLADLRRRLARARITVPPLPAVSAGGVLLIVAVVTFWDLGSIPYGLWWDEANFGLYAQQILHHSIDFPLLAPFGDPSLEFYLHAVEQLIFGATEFSTRVLVALCGIAGVGLVGLLAAMLWNRWVALIAMIVLGFMRWHINFSRFGIHEMTFQAFELAVVVTLVAGIQRRKPGWFALCGVLLGLSIHIYSPGFALTGLVLLTLAYAAVFLRPRLNLSLVALVGIGFVLAYAPLLEAGIQTPALFNARANQVSVFGPNNQYPPLQALEHNLRAHALMFNVEGDRNGRHNIPGQPQLDDISAVLFVLGLAWIAIRARKPQYAFLIVWFLAMMAPGVLSLDFEAPQSGRAAGAQPAVAMFIALALAGASTMLARAANSFVSRARISWILATALAGVVLATISVSNVQAYFYAETHNESVWEVWASDATFVGQQLATLAPSEQTYVSPEFSGHPDIAYLAPGHSTGAPLSPSLDLPFVGVQPIAVFLSRNDYFYAPLLKAYYPKARMTVLQGPELSTPPLAYEIQLSPSDLSGAEGLTFHFTGRGTHLSSHVSTLGVPAPAPDGPGLATWIGGFRIANYGPSTLSLKAPGRIAVAVDGYAVCSGDRTLTCVRTWARGNHSIQVRVLTQSRARLYLRWHWAPSATTDFFDSWLRGHGLTASYYSNAGWKGAPAFVQREPQVDYYYQTIPLPRPFSVEWRGYLQIPRTGAYAFAIDSVDDSSISIDGRPVLSVAANKASFHTVSLVRGRHRVRVRLQAVNQFTHIFLTWMPPGRTVFTPVPAENFQP